MAAKELRSLCIRRLKCIANKMSADHYDLKAWACPCRGQAHCYIAAGGTSTSVAVIEPLEVCLRARLGRQGKIKLGLL